MQHNIYIDEKGPQEHLRLAKRDQGLSPNHPMQRFSIGNDQTVDYVMAAVDIPVPNLSDFESEFKFLEESYLKNTQYKGELKGAHLLKNNHLDNGIASLPERETQYYLNLLELFEKYNVTTCIVTESKIASLVNGRLKNWILDVSEGMHLSPQILDYVLVKYVTIEASKSVLECMLDVNKTVPQILTAIRADLTKIVGDTDESNLRMKDQVNTYLEIIGIVDAGLYSAVYDPKTSGEFDWDKIAFSLSLWIEERNLFESDNTYTLFLDEGIKSENIGGDLYQSIHCNQISSNVVGLRCADLLASLIGKLIVQLNLATLYDSNHPKERALLSSDWFNLNSKQLLLVKKLTRLIVDSGEQYSLTVGTYFDDAIHLMGYFRYVSRFSDETILTQASAEDEFGLVRELVESYWATMGELPAKLACLYPGKTVSEVIKEGLLKPL